MLPKFYKFYDSSQLCHMFDFERKPTFMSKNNIDTLNNMC